MELYLAGADIIGEGLPAPLNCPRAGALETFNLLGIPPRGSGYGDRYHYTDLRNLFQQEYERYFTPSYPSAALAMPETEGERLSLLNGVLYVGTTADTIRKWGNFRVAGCGRESLSGTGGALL